MHTTLSDGGGHPDGADPGANWPAPEREPGEQARVIGGVAALVGTRLGLNPFWLRMAFVVLALAGGLGIVVYAGLWLILIAGAGQGRRPLRIAGGAVIAVCTLYLLDNGRTAFVGGTPAAVALLIGLALALWQPRLPAAVASPRRPTDLAEAMPAPPQRRAARRAPSMLGQATLGLAVVTAAAGALIDQANGGRLHPEQWLGAAAVVCGAGMLVGVVRGRARWLILPAAVFVGAGYIGGAAAERGIRLQDRGHRYVDINDANPDPSASVSFGDVDFGIYDVPSPAQRGDVRVLVGDVRISVGSTVDPSIDLRWNVAHGSASIDGVRQAASGSTHLGPDRPADIVLAVSIWRGDLSLFNQPAATADGSANGAVTTTFVPVDPSTGDPDSAGLTPVRVADGVTATADGFFLLADGDAMIDDTDHLVVGTSYVLADGVTGISTKLGQFRLLPRGILLTPTGDVIDLHALRTRLAEPPTTTTLTTITAPTGLTTPTVLTTPTAITAGG